jgi:hypothetical protein
MSKTNKMKLLKTFYKEDIPDIFRKYTNGMTVVARTIYGDIVNIKDGYVHSDNDMPAIIRANGDKAWYEYSLKHRSDDKPAVIGNDGGMIWYYKGKQHRDHGPAIICPGPDKTKIWMNNGKIFRDMEKSQFEYADGSRAYIAGGGKQLKDPRMFMEKY